MVSTRVKAAAIAFALTALVVISLELQEIGVEFANLILYCVAWGTVVAPEERLLVLTEPVIGGGRSAVRLGTWTVLGTALGCAAGLPLAALLGVRLVGVPPWPLGPSCGRGCMLSTGALAFLLALVVAERLFSRGARRGSPTWELLRALGAASESVAPRPSREGVVEAWLRACFGREAGIAREIYKLQKKLRKLRDQAEIFRARFYLYETRGVPLDDWIPKKAREVEREIRETEKRIEELRAELAEGFKALLSSQQ